MAEAAPISQGAVILKNCSINLTAGAVNQEIIVEDATESKAQLDPTLEVRSQRACDPSSLGWQS